MLGKFINFMSTSLNSEKIDLNNQTAFNSIKEIKPKKLIKGSTKFASLS